MMEFQAQLRPRRFHSADRVLGLPGGTEDNDMWVIIHDVNDEVLGPQDGVTSVYAPTDRQRRMIAAGANIALTCLGGQPPVMLRLTNEPLGKPPDA